MVTDITHGIKVSVETFYQPESSSPRNGEFVFAYRITIENKGRDAMQLLRRHWFIFDSMGESREVEGEGVVGEQPVIEPGGLHQYVSGCHLKSAAGKMYGTYLMENQKSKQLVEVRIPVFQLVADFMLN
ncbi:MAG: Co2+/Mg2+ efflux protein ApaG [Chitinophagales bacterium]